MLTRKAEILTMLGKTTSLTAAEEGLLDLLHPLAEAAVGAYLQMDLSYARHVEYLPIGQPLNSDSLIDDVDFRVNTAVNVTGRGGIEMLQLKHTPVWLAGLQVWEDIGANAGQTSGSFGSDSLLTAGDDYWLDVDDGITDISRSGLLHRYGVWPVEPRSVKVSYYGGFTSSQLATNGAGAAVKFAVLRTVVAAFFAARANQRSGGAGLKQSESIGSYSYSLGPGAAGLAGGCEIPLDAKNLLQPYRNYGRIFATG